jgi:hypothetical protein
LRIDQLFKNNFNEYLHERNKFEKQFGKSCKCDVCGECGVELVVYNGQTYCKNHIPIERQRYERKVIAGRHGSAKSFIKKIE